MRKKEYLVYQVYPCEMGSEGWSGWEHYAAVQAIDEDEAVQEWCKVMKIKYGFIDDSLKYLKKKDDGSWSCYYPITIQELPTSVYGHSQPLFIEKQYRKHID